MSEHKMTEHSQNQNRILITGAARRVGAALAEALAADGWPLVLHYNRNHKEAAILAERLADDFGIEVTLMQADLADPEACQDMMAEVLAKGPLGGLINNASRFGYDSATDFKPDEIAQHMAVNLTAPALLTQAYAKALSADEKGHVINMLDAKLFGLNPDYFTYTLSKAALHNLTLISAQAFAPQLRINAIAPGIILPSGPQDEAAFQLAHRRNPLNQGADIQEIVAAMRFLLSARSITGEVIVIDGGLHLNPPSRDVAFLDD
ncbi:MAG: SDR family oxidoreductase [Candidatus Puniceispirillaceae bacterium]